MILDRTCIMPNMVVKGFLIIIPNSRLPTVISLCIIYSVLHLSAVL